MTEDMNVRALIAVLINGCALASAALPPFADSLTTKVDPFIGTSGDGHCHPAAARPFGMVQAGPDTGRGTWDYCSGYRYEDKTIKMFSQTHLSGTGCPDAGDLGILPFVGEPDESGFDKTDETAHPGYYAVKLARGGIGVEIAAEKHGAMYRFDFGDKPEGKILVDLTYCLGNDRREGWGVGEVVLAETSVDDAAISGRVRRRGWIPERDYFFALETDRRPVVREFPRRQGDKAPRYELSFAGGGTVCLKLALSATNVEAAKRNLVAELPDWDFNRVRSAARAEWEELLARVKIEARADGQDRVFYTALYHLFLQPNLISDVGAEKIRYSGFSLWDTFRAAHPLYTLLVPERVPDFVDSLLWHYERDSHLPRIPHWGLDTQCMIGTHSVPVIVDAYLKGLWPSVKDGEQERKIVDGAFEKICETLTKTHLKREKEDWDLLDAYGYYPCDVLKGEGVSRTLECSYDDYCAALMARKIGRHADAEFFERRAANWTNVIDRSVGFARGRMRSGAWREPFDPMAFGHEGSWAGDFTEGNAYQWTWHVLQDPEGLFGILGGRDAALSKLEALFKTNDDFSRYRRSRDVTGFVGQYVHGNEPSHHIPYFFQYLGRGDRTAELVRCLCETFHRTGPSGVCGNEDCGQMSAWYVCAALGFYPVNPCGGEYIIGSPQVRSAVISLPEGRMLRMGAWGISEKAKYVRSVTFGDKRVEGFKLRHADLVTGGSLVFEMTEKSNGVVRNPVRIIFDTDMVEDYDDVGALAMLHALADAGECEPIAMATCTRDNQSVAAVEVINAFYGRPDIPVGCSKEIGVVGVPTKDPTRKGHQKYVRLAKEYAPWVRHWNSNDAPDANEVYRRALAESPDGSVVFISVGFLTNMRRLLETKADAYSPLDGCALVAKKVRWWSAMACKYPKGSEYNSEKDPESSRIALDLWPTPIYFSDFDFGRNVYAGRAVAERTYAYRNPIKDIFARCLPSREAVRTGKCWDKDEGGHSAWDETTVLAGVFPPERYFKIEHGRFRMTGQGGDNEWIPDLTVKGGRLADKYTKAEIGGILDELIAREPKKK